MADSAWVSEAIVEFLRGPMYVHPLMAFIDDKCLIFTPEEENKFEYTIIHGEFQELVDRLLTDFLGELGVSVEEFFKIAGESKDKLTTFVVQTILTVDDFLMFKAMMVKRNIDLTNQVLGAVDELKAAMDLTQDHTSPVYPTGAAERTSASSAPPAKDKGAAGAPAKAAPAKPEEAKEVEEATRLSALEAEAEARKAALIKLMRSLQLQDEDVALALAIAESLKDSARSQSELAELEQAIALSLALEAEQRRLAAAGKDAPAGTGSGAAAGSSSGSSGAAAGGQGGDGGGGARALQSDLVTGAFPEPNYAGGMAPLPKLPDSRAPLPPVNVKPLDPLNIGPNEAADKMSAVAAAAAHAASLLASATDSPKKNKEEKKQLGFGSNFTPAEIKVPAGKAAASAPPQEASPKGRFVPAPLNLPDKAPKAPVEVPGAEELPERTSAGGPGGIAGLGKMVSMRSRAAGFKSGASDLSSVREAAAAAAATQKNLIAAQKAGKAAGEDDAANAWLQDAKKQLVAKKKAEREAEMAAYQEQQKGKGGAGGKGGAAAGGESNDDLDRRRQELRDRLAQQLRQDLLTKS